MNSITEKLKKTNILNLVFYTSVGFTFLYLLLRFALVFSYSNDIGGIESSVIYSLSKVLNGLPLYGDPEAKNFDITQYAPVLYVVNLFFDKGFSFDPLKNVHEIYIVARLINLIVNVLAGILLARLFIRKLGIDKKMAFIGVSLFFLYLTRFHFAGRPDALFNLDFILFLYYFVAYLQTPVEFKKKRIIYFVLASFFIAFSFFIKQSGIQFFGIVPLFFLLKVEIKKFLSFSFLTGLFLIFFLFVFQAMFGEYFFKNIIGGIKNGMKLTNAFDLFSNFYLKSSVIFVFGVLGMFYYFLKLRTELEKFISLSIGFIFIFSCLLTTKVGAGINYFNEFIVITIVFAVMEIKKIQSIELSIQPYFRFGSVLFGLYILFLFPNLISQKIYHEHMEHLKAEKSVLDGKIKLAQLLQKKLKEDPRVYFVSFDTDINILLSAKAAVPNKDMVPFQTNFNYDLFRKEVGNGTIKYVVYNNDRIVNSFMATNFNAFTVLYRDQLFTIMENKIKLSINE
jgi:hypothetical protein